MLHSRPYDKDSTVGFQDWAFMSVQQWEENPDGNWTFQGQSVDGKRGSCQLFCVCFKLNKCVFLQRHFTIGILSSTVHRNIPSRLLRCWIHTLKKQPYNLLILKFQESFLNHAMNNVIRASVAINRIQACIAQDVKNSGLRSSSKGYQGRCKL